MENVKFIEEKMKGIEEKMNIIQNDLSILDTALYSASIRMMLSDDEKEFLITLFTNKEREYEELKAEYKKFNNVRLQLLGLK